MKSPRQRKMDRAFEPLTRSCGRGGREALTALTLRGPRAGFVHARGNTPIFTCLIRDSPLSSDKHQSKAKQKPLNERDPKVEFQSKRLSCVLSQRWPSTSAAGRNSTFFVSFFADFANDCSKSWMISSICSVPTEMRIMSSVTPLLILSSSDSCS